MHPYPHRYSASASGSGTGLVTAGSAGLPGLETASPPQFDGPDGVWSPETLLCASLADCFILTFRAVSRAARFEWLRLECRVEGVLERVTQGSQFTRFTTFATLTVPAGADAAKARALLERAEHGCLIANSLRGTRTLEAQIIVAAAIAPAELTASVKLAS
ncbi:MAG TPA: OsmC family protein [Steroidobacteraceae bacterium]|nr:OsmC family protein [Steroidobacteraceae bacterium]